MSPSPPLSRPPDLLAGFISVHPDPGLPELVMAGEQWGHGGQFIGEHRHEVWEFYHQVSGESRWRVPGKNWKLAPGSLLAVPPGVSHRMDAPQPEEHHYYFAAIDPEAVRKRHPELPDVFRGRTAWMRENAHAVAPVFATLVREVSLLKEARGLGLRLAVDALLLEIARTAGSRAAPLSATLAWHPGVERAVGVIRQNPGQSLTVASLARARELVESSNLPLTQMAHELGFASSQHLSGAFREAFGCPPRTWKMRSGQSRKSSN